MSARIQELLRNAHTVDETDALNKIRASYHEEYDFNSYYGNIASMLQKLRYNARLKYVPSSEQLRFIMTRAKRVAVVAGAGSGKTVTMNNRVMCQKEIFNIPGSQILPLTFTNNSANDMNKKYEILARAFAKKPDVDFRTIHKFGKDFITLMNPNIVILAEDKPITQHVHQDGEVVEIEHHMNDIIEQVLTMCDVDLTTVNPKSFYSALSVISEKMIASDEEFRDSSEEYLDFPLTYDQLTEIRKVYQGRKKLLGCIDFMDMLEIIYGTLKNIPVLSRVASEPIRNFLTFMSIYVDEVQDVSPLQIAIIQELLRLNPDCSLCIVGDDDQSIYGFRGADPSFLLNFAEIFAPITVELTEPELQIIGTDEDGEPIYEEVEPVQEQATSEPEPVEIIYMTKNRRSAKKIIKVANKVIKNNKYRYDKEMTPMKASTGEVKLIEDIHNMMSTGIILKTLREEHAKGAGILNHIGILYREHKQVIPILQLLVKNRIPFNSVYNEYSNNYVFNMSVTRDILGIIDMVSDLQNPLLIRRYLYKFCPNIDKKGADSIANTLAAEQRKPKSKDRRKISAILKENVRWEKDIPQILELYNMLQKEEMMTVVVNYCFDKYTTAYFANISKDKPDLEEVAKICLDYLTEGGTEMSWMAFKSKHGNTIKWVKENSRVTNGVRLTSFHSAKGLEFEKVFILEVSSKYSPKAFLLDKYTEKGRAAYIEEERRLFYVAITRAEEELTVFYSSDDPDSLFIKEFREALLEVESEMVGGF